MFQFSLLYLHLYAALRPHIDGGIAAYIRRCRLTTARDLLKKTDLPIADIAARVGFDDYNYFLRVFKKTYGASPKRMR
jgi:transcriptional regulator GlxA family with amidase domain